MQELIEQFINYLKGIWLNKIFIVLAIWVICPVGWYFIWKMPDQYQANAQVYVDTQSLLRPLLRGLAIQPNSDSQIRLMVKTLMTRPNLEKIARMSDLDIMSKDQSGFDEIIRDLEDNLRIGSSARENFFRLSYSSEHPETARNVIQAALDVFVENTLGETRNEADTAEQFLERQIAEYERRLLEDERRLTEFKQANAEVVGTNVGNFYGVLQTNKSRLEEAQLQLREVQSRLTSAQAQLRGEQANLDNSADSSGPGIETEFDARIEQLQVQLDELSLKYTDKHPNIIEIRRRLEDLEKSREEVIEEYKEAQKQVASGGPGVGSNPVYQQLKLTVTQLENEKVSLEVRVKEYQTKVKEIEEKIHLVPEIESQVIALNRGYEITRSKYNELLSRREQARLSQNADLAADDIQFKVVDPPRVPQEPTGPNRLLLMTAIFVLSIGAGVAVSFLLSQIRPVVLSGSQLTLLTGHPVFGTVSLANGNSIVSKERLQKWVFIGALMAILAVYAALVVINLKFG
ncbi:XrtA system polysaccharide chain length determinant [Hahella ganghwensis]|uniref:XrtA system polysaccharide chain length determinant n=1 Tax=Hahella ganghwensis TaxID=286420 RepID=UPI00037512A6|nr:XrtA system polysaccharide chain length determinant [Hahella ganghwensis]